MADPISLTIGIVPIVAGIIKQYSSVHLFCRRFKHHKAGVDDLLRFVRRQQKIFHNESRLLLADAVGTDKALMMLKDAEHHGWSDVETTQRVEDLLGDQKDDLIDAAKEVLEQIQRLQEELVDEDRLTNRIKFGVTKTKLDSICTSVRNATKDYRTLRQQVHDLAHQKPVIESATGNQCNLPRVQAIRTAAKHVYEALTAACKLHTNHHAHISLKPIYNATRFNAEIRFQIAYRHLSKQQANNNRDVLWFVVESVISGTLLSVPMTLPSTTTSIADFCLNKASGKRSLDLRHSRSQETIKSTSKRVRFRSPSPVTCDRTQLDDIVAISPNDLPDLCSSADLCRKLLAAHRKDKDTEACIGFLEDSGTWKHRVFRSQSPVQETRSIMLPETQALADLLMQKHEVNHPGPLITPRQRLLIAKSLATGLLDYHSTPWMNNSWRSKDIILYNADVTSALATTSVEPELFVEVPVCQASAHLDGSCRSSFDSPYIRNSTLFSLGVMLIELGFEKPLHTMLRPCDARHAAISPLEKDWNAAVRLSKEIGTSMGMRFARLVDQCLFCDFGHGTELDNPALQDAVYRDVVTELDGIIEGFSQL